MLYLRSFLLSQDLKNLENGPIVTFYVLNNNFFCAQVASAYVPDDTDTFFLFFLQ